MSAGRAGSRIQGRPVAEPDFDAVSLRAVPNSTSRAVAHEAMGARMRIVAANQRRRTVSAPRMRGGARDRPWENEVPDWEEGAQVIRVRDPAKPYQQRPQTAKVLGVHQKQPLQERPTNIFMRVRVLQAAAACGCGGYGPMHALHDRTRGCKCTPVSEGRI